MSYAVVRPRLRARRGIGDDTDATAAAVPDSDLSQEQYQQQQQLLSTVQQQYAWFQAVEAKATLHAYIQVAATLCIPLAAAVWKHYLRKRKLKSSEG
jgi:hypothetical protein